MLYIVATPIGNLEDITLRALRVLKEVDFIAAEDTRHTRKLLTHYDIHTRLVSFHEHSTPEKRAWLLEVLRDGQDVALVSDAGTPLISDPGAVLVSEAAEQGIPITSVPGACAAITAMTLSGIGSGFAFIGFLSKKTSERRGQLERVAVSYLPCVVYESPHALKETLEALEKVLEAERTVVIAKELTKIHETVFRGGIAAAREAFSGDLKGEYVLIVSAAPEKAFEEVSDERIREALHGYIATGMTKKDAAKAASDTFGISKNRTYRLTL
jgi:16S rRNA (cytidine1402-2'-O)-methyltransferase